MKTEIRFHEGLKGSGVVVSISYGQDRLIFDFGAPFRPNTAFYDGVVLHRPKSALQDALTLGETPQIDGIYPRTLLSGADIISRFSLQPYEESTMKTAVLISHLHLDHMSNIGYLAEEIPVIMHKNGKKLLDALTAIGEGTQHRNVNSVEYGQQYNWGVFKFTPYFSDHPCFGSAGYLIEAPDTKIYYTGDIRYHGLQKERAFAEIEKLTQEKIDVLIVDGTSYSPSKFKHDAAEIGKIAQPNKEILAGMFLEETVYQDVRTKLSESKQLGLFNLYHRDMQLIEALLKYVSQANRSIVFEPKTAWVINEVLGLQVHVYFPDFPMEEGLAEKVRQRNIVVSEKQINQEPSKYLVQVSYENLLSLYSFDTKGSYFFHLFAEPFGSGNRACQIFERVLNQKEIQLVSYSNVYSFNHAFPNHLSYIIGCIGAKNVVAVHSNVPEKLNAMGSHHVLPVQNEPYVLEQGRLVKKSECDEAN